MNKFDAGPDCEAAFLGPPLSAGPLPALFYFSLSAYDSLCTDPYNQPVAYLSALPMRIFSLSLPGHENNQSPLQALTIWAQKISSGKDIIGEFIQKIQRMLELLETSGALLPGRTAVAGLSRGAFIAMHAAAKIPTFRYILGFAPLTDLSHAKEFQTIRSAPSTLALHAHNCIDALTDRTVRCYIGNCDVRVGTRLCFDFIEKLSQAALEKRIRSPQAELFITPSIGQHGHGTSKEIFHEGAQWIAEKLGAIDVV